MLLGVMLTNCTTSEFQGWINLPYFKMLETKRGESIEMQYLVNMACALYDLGAELNSGNLKDLDLDNFSLITFRKASLTLILVVEQPGKNPIKKWRYKKKRDFLRKTLPQLHNHCSIIVNEELCQEEMLKKAQSHLFESLREFRTFRKDLEKLSFWSSND